MMLPQPLAKALFKVAALVTHYFPDQDWCTIAGAEVCHPNATCQNFAGNFNCLCNDGFTGNGTTCVPMKKDCQDILNGGYNSSGFYQISPGKGLITEVYCDMDTKGGGWTEIQRRSDPDTDFYRKWNEYKHGFSDPTSKDGWIGNDALHLMTSSKAYTLRFDLEDFGNNTYWAEYTTFSVGPEQDQYRLKLNGFSGSEGLMDALKHHDGERFITKDRDIRNKAKIFQTGWWFADGFSANPNGLLHKPPQRSFQNMFWFASDGRDIYLQSCTMKLRAQ